MLPPPPRSTLFPYTTLFRSFTPVPVASLGEAVSQVLAGKADAFLAPVPVVSDYLESAMVNGIGLAVLLDNRPVDRKSTRLNSSHVRISYAVFCLKKKNIRA